MTMIERVARAIYETTRPAHYAAWDHLPRTQQVARFAEARAAIEAMREPSRQMIDRGGDVLADCKDSDWDSGSDGESHNSYEWIISGSQTTIYQAMIDAALTDKPKGE